MESKMSTLSNQTRCCLAVISCVCLFSTGCSQYYAHRGAAWGGLTGAGVGAAIGKANGNTLAGTAIGSAVGAVTGAAVGDAIDEVNYRNEQQRVAQASYATPTDIASMANAGIGSDVIIQHVQANGFSGPLNSADLIWMKQQGVQDDVLRALQDSSRPVAAAVPIEPPPMVVEEHYYAHPPFRPIHPREYLTRRFGRRSPRAGFHVALHN